MHWTPVVQNPLSFYAINMTAILVGGFRIPIDPKELTLEAVNVNQTMTILDSGSTINALREPYNSQFISAYSNATSNLAQVIDAGQLTFNISADVFNSYVFPTVSYIFQKWEKSNTVSRALSSTTLTSLIFNSFQS
jgi:pSer/pThr/pTyr-binding forkhead associated (FHA) protein